MKKDPTPPTRHKVELRPTSQLKPYPGNTRFHSDEQIQKIAKSIKTFGFLIPPLIDAENGVIAGHGRLEAAKLLGMDTVPTICVDHLTRCGVERKSLNDLLSNPLICGMFRHVEMNDMASFVT